MNRKLCTALLLTIMLFSLSACNLGSRPEEVTIQESTPLQDMAGVKMAFFRKYKKPVREIKLNIEHQTPGHMRGKMYFAEETETTARTFLARKKERTWELIFEAAEGKALPTCEELEPYNFPEEMTTDCTK